MAAPPDTARSYNVPNGVVDEGGGPAAGSTRVNCWPLLTGAVAITVLVPIAWAATVNLRTFPPGGVPVLVFTFTVPVIVPVAVFETGVIAIVTVNAPPGDVGKLSIVIASCRISGNSVPVCVVKSGLLSGFEKVMPLPLINWIG